MQEQEQNLQQKAEDTPGTKETAEKEIFQMTAAGQDGRQGELQNRPIKSGIPVIHTLKGDVSEYIKNKAISLADIAAEASKRRRFDETENQSKKFLVLISAIVLLIAGLGIGGWLIFFKEKPVSPETAFQPPKSLILSEKREIITLKSENRSEIIDLVQNAVQAPIAPNSVVNIPILLETEGRKEFLQAKNFFNILEINLPLNLVQSLEGPFTFGVFYQKQNEPFLILKIKSFDFALSGMRDWEKNIAEDIKAVISIKNIPPPTQKFEDKIIKNRDTRILYDNSNNPIIAYAFIERQYLAITPDTGTLEEIIRRFSVSPQRDF